MLKIELNKSEYNYLHEAPFLSNDHRYLLSTANQLDDAYILEISKTNADEIRDCLGERLQLVGFDKEYDLTTEGEILEGLIDKFFIDTL